MLQIYSSPPLYLFSRTSSGISSSVIFIRGEEQRWKPAAASGQDLSNPVIQPSQQTTIWEVWAHQETWTIWADPDLPGGEEGILHSPNTFSCDFFLEWVFFPLFFQWKQLFLETRLKGPLFVTDNSETHTHTKKKAFNPAPTEIPLSAAWPSWIACAAEQIPSLIPSSLCKIKIHHRHRTGYIFVLGTGSYVAICGCEQRVEVTEPAFQEIPKQSQDGCSAL